MITRKLVYLSCCLAAVLVLSCGEKRPDGILTKDQMVSALTDFYLKEAKLNTLGFPPDSTTTLMEYYKDEYSRGKRFADTTLDASYQYYLNKPLELSIIYDRVIDSLALREQRADSLGIQ
jgi:hypothetical protein